MVGVPPLPGKRKLTSVVAPQEEVDKFSQCGFNPVNINDFPVPVIEGCEVAFGCEIQKTRVEAGNFIASILDEFYPQDDYHSIYFGEIKESWSRG